MGLRLTRDYTTLLSLPPEVLIRQCEIPSSFFSPFFFFFYFSVMFYYMFGFVLFSLGGTRRSSKVVQRLHFQSCKNITEINGTEADKRLYNVAIITS